MTRTYAFHNYSSWGGVGRAQSILELREMSFILLTVDPSKAKFRWRVPCSLRSPFKISQGQKEESRCTDKSGEEFRCSVEISKKKKCTTSDRSFSLRTPEWRKSKKSGSGAGDVCGSIIYQGGERASWLRKLRTHHQHFPLCLPSLSVTTCAMLNDESHKCKHPLDLTVSIQQWILSIQQIQ